MTALAQVLDWGTSAPHSEIVARLSGGATVLEWPLVDDFRRRCAQAMCTDRPTNPDDAKVWGASIIRQVVRAHAAAEHLAGSTNWPLVVEEAYIKAVYHAIFGYGRLQPLFEIPDAENIEINGCDYVVVQGADGRRRRVTPLFDTDEELIDAVRFLGELAQPARAFDDAHPTMTLALGDRFRVHAIGFGLSHRPSITIRQHRLTDVTLADLAAQGMLPGEVADLLQACVRARKSIVVAGDQGAGKTTLLRALIAAIPTGERFGTVETDYELLTHLQPERAGVVALQARTGMGERLGEHHLGTVTVADLLPEALRQNLTRLIVGEVRGGEAGAMFEAMHTGTGTMSTTHAHDAASTVDRLAARVAQGGAMSMEQAYQQVGHHLHLIVYVRLVDDTWRGGGRRRYVEEIQAMTGAFEGGRPVSHVVYCQAPDGEQYFCPDARLEADIRSFRDQRVCA